MYLRVYMYISRYEICKGYTQGTGRTQWVNTHYMSIHITAYAMAFLCYQASYFELISRNGLQTKPSTPTQAVGADPHSGGFCSETALKGYGGLPL